MDPNNGLRVSTDKYIHANSLYASLIGSLNYCAVATRPNISYATNRCAQYASNPNIIHWEAAKRIVRYLLDTKEYGIMYHRYGEGVRGFAHGLAGYADADFAGDRDDRKSTTGWLFTFNGAPISWASKKQSTVSRSSMESELVAGSFATAEGIWLIRLARDFRHNFTPIPLFTDNQSAIAFSNNEAANNRTKHIDTHFHYTKEQMNLGNISLRYIPTLDNPADILTKPLGPRKHLHNLELLGMRRA